GRTLLEILHRGDEHRSGIPREEASRALARYELAHAAEQSFESLSGGQQARLQILLLELGGATLLLLDEPTDNLDLESAEALQQALATFDGTVLAVTHDRWFVRDMDRSSSSGPTGTSTSPTKRSGMRAGSPGRGRERAHCAERTGSEMCRRVNLCSVQGAPRVLGCLGRPRS